MTEPDPELEQTSGLPRMVMDYPVEVTGRPAWMRDAEQPDPEADTE